MTGSPSIRSWCWKRRPFPGASRSRPCARIRGRAAARPEQKRAVFQENASAYTPASLARAWEEIGRIPFVEIAWGRDIWECPGMHVGYLKNLLR